ncbi:MBL fold metallo-hydrolase [Pseudalkalibacillus berkeleyi]|uniref:MBL fold metallo-hydrolase n=1 Tax=Pseudalkalibacillus berkeleyi TaxID=1069813 RepID=A0ABS9GXQ7_9BACL|nr:MBL fold metallo-hydrolase [Pseudalkalibacillus berkeleyi]MCF6136526.1 MBL fold metallo-hydrolase [Pseudalkalibacillus berkeleyi]
MEIKQISEHIWSLKTWMIVPIHVWIVKGEDGVTLVDAGIGNMGKGILKFVKALDAGPLNRIVLTHGHPDHVGAIKKILAETDVSVYAHKIEIPYMEGKLAYPGRKKASASVEEHLAQPLEEDELGTLKTIGGLIPYLTPGHAPGHVVYYHPKDQVLLAGDLFTSKSDKLYRPMPMFTYDMEEAVRSSRIVGKLKPKRLEVCHGKAVLNPAEHLDQYIQNTSKKYAIKEENVFKG